MTKIVLDLGIFCKIMFSANIREKTPKNLEKLSKTDGGFDKISAC